MERILARAELVAADGDADVVLAIERSLSEGLDQVADLYSSRISELLKQANSASEAKENESAASATTGQEDARDRAARRRFSGLFCLQNGF